MTLELVIADLTKGGAPSAGAPPSGGPGAPPSGAPTGQPPSRWSDPASVRS
jgi:hypothetical protein